VAHDLRSSIGKSGQYNATVSIAGRAVVLASVVASGKRNSIRVESWRIRNSNSGAIAYNRDRAAPRSS
jgi:hypothetical protein